MCKCEATKTLYVGHTKDNFEYFQHFFAFKKTIGLYTNKLFSTLYIFSDNPC